MESNEMSKALETARDSWPQPLRRSPVEDGFNVALLPLRLGVHIVKGLDDEANRATDELSRLRDMLESEEDY